LADGATCKFSSSNECPGQPSHFINVFILSHRIDSRYATPNFVYFFCGEIADSTFPTVSEFHRSLPFVRNRRTLYDNSAFSLKLARAVRTREPMFSKNVLPSQCRGQFMKRFSVSSTLLNQRKSGGCGGYSIKYKIVAKYNNYGNTSIASTPSISKS
jgi:hypothetical protein